MAGDGGGPERIFWPEGKAPADRYRYGVKWFKGLGAARYALRVYRGKKLAATKVGQLTDNDRDKYRGSSLMNIKIPCLCGEMRNAGEALGGSQVTCYKCGRPHVVPRLAQDRPAVVGCVIDPSESLRQAIYSPLALEAARGVRPDSI